MESERMTGGNLSNDTVEYEEQQIIFDFEGTAQADDL